jgi:hypothetical protein
MTPYDVKHKINSSRNPRQDLEFQLSRISQFSLNSKRRFTAMRCPTARITKQKSSELGVFAARLTVTVGIVRVFGKLIEKVFIYEDI